MAPRKPNPARKATPSPPVTRTIAPADIESARARFRKHAPRRYWGLVDATPAPTPQLPKKPQGSV